MYDLVVKGGLLIDPHQGICEHMDIAISKRKIADVRKGINAAMAKQVINASDMIVTPGLIDIHTHCCYKIAYLAIDPESMCLAKGSTTIADAGSTGELLFPAFREYVINRSKTRIYAFINIESLGMIEFAKNQKWAKLITDYEDLFIHSDNTLKMIHENKDIIVGIKWAHHTLKGLKLAREVADKAGCILMAENHYQPETLKYMKSGDILTHIFHAHPASLKLRPNDGLLDEKGRVQQEFFDAIRRGVLLDVGHGMGSFSWKVAEQAFREDIKPDTISTDLWVESIKTAYNMPTVMSKFLLLGMSLEEVIRASTAKPAEVLGKLGEIGTLKIGSCADITILKLQKGRFPLLDTLGEVRCGQERLITVGVIRGGDVVYNRLS